MTQKPLSNGNDLEVQLNLKELELNSLLEVTDAINTNFQEEALYKIYQFTLASNLHIKALALYVHDSDKKRSDDNGAWVCKVSYGENTQQELPFEYFEQVNEIRPASEITGFSSFDLAVPIWHKEKLLAYVFIQGLEKKSGAVEKSVLSFIQTLTNIIIVAIENRKLAQKELNQQAFIKELEIARKVQSNLFPKNLPKDDSIEVYASYYPHSSVGGDYYDLIPVSETEYAICIADVSGKGVPAALLMSNLQASLRTLLRQTTDLKKVVHELNYIVNLNSKGDRFITLFLGLFSLNTKKIKYINAGHNPPIIFFGDKMQELDQGTTILGAFEELPFIEKGELEVTPDTFFFAYTDGVTETRNPEEEEYGTERLKDELNIIKNEDIETGHQKIYHALNNFRKGSLFTDDLTFISCRIF